MESIHVIFFLVISLLAVNFFVKSRLVLPFAGFFLCVSGILEISDGGMGGSGDLYFQWAFIVLAICLCLKGLFGLYGYIFGYSE